MYGFRVSSMAERSTEELVDVLDDASPRVTQAPPTTLEEEVQKALSGMESMVSLDSWNQIAGRLWRLQGLQLGDRTSEPKMDHQKAVRGRELYTEARRVPRKAGNHADRFVTVSALLARRGRRRSEHRGELTETGQAAVGTDAGVSGRGIRDHRVKSIR